MQLNTRNLQLKILDLSCRSWTALSVISILIIASLVFFRAQSS